MNISHVPCVAHTLNLIVQQALQISKNYVIGAEKQDINTMERIPKKCCNIVGFFKKSGIVNVNGKTKTVWYYSSIKYKTRCLHKVE